MNKVLKRGLLAVGGAAVAGSASAAVDPSITTALTAAGADAAIVGAAVLVVIVGIKAFKFIRQAL